MGQFWDYETFEVSFYDLTQRFHNQINTNKVTSNFIGEYAQWHKDHFPFERGKGRLINTELRLLNCFSPTNKLLLIRLKFIPQK